MWLEVLDSLWQGTPLNWFGYINILVYFLFSSPNKKYDKQVEVNNAFCTHQRLFELFSCKSSPHWLCHNQVYSKDFKMIHSHRVVNLWYTIVTYQTTKYAVQCWAKYMIIKVQKEKDDYTWNWCTYSTHTVCYAEVRPYYTVIGEQDTYLL